MSYRASAALAYEPVAYGYESAAYELSFEEPHLELVEGGRRARKAAPEAAILAMIVRAVVTVVAAIALVGVARVGIYTATVNVLQDNSALRSEIRDAQAASGALEVEGARLASSERITQIATDTLGMVLAEDVEIVYVTGSSDPMSVSSVVAATAARARSLGAVAYSASASAGLSRVAQVTYGTDHAVAAG